ncbi:MAG: protein kinase [Luteimonas sp.]
MNERIDRWRRVSDLFDRVVDMDREQRANALAVECADDPSLRIEVEKLLHADGLTNPLDHDIAGHASAMLLAGDAEAMHGELFGPYRIIKLLGQGGMGRVYLAQREGDDFAQTVALKLVGGVGSANIDAARRRFVEERRILARLEHPHIARLLDGGVGRDSQPWFAMEYVEGAPLTEWCDARKLGIDARLELFAKICDAVDHAHRFLIVHRDLKPGNLLVDGRGDPKVLDFGIAKLLDDEGHHPGEASTILMTPDYAAPEQMRGGQISTATDAYSLGAVLFELITGQRPFSDPLASRDPPSASRAVTQNRTALTQRAAACSTTPHALRKTLRGDIDRIVRTALDPDPARRYGSVAKLADDLRAVASRQPISLRSDRAYRAGIFLRRNRWGVAAASIAIVGLIATTGWALWQTQQTAKRAREAAQQARIATQESRTAISVKNLVAGLLGSAAPEVALGRQLTVKDVLDASRQTMRATLQGEPAVAVELLTVMARSYTALEDHASAHALLDQAMAMAPKVNAERRVALHTARAELAMEESDVPTMQAATTTLRQLLPNVRDPALRIDARLVMGEAELHQERGSLADTLTLLKEVRATFPPGDIRRVKAASMVASTYLKPGAALQDVQAAMVLLENSLAEAQLHQPARHPDVMDLREQLATTYTNQTHFAKALALYRVIRDDTIAVHGNGSVQVALVEAQLSRVEMYLGHFAATRQHAERALRIYTTNPSTDPMDRSATKMLLGQAAEIQQKYAEAQHWYEESNKDFEAASPAMAQSMPFLQLNVARMMVRQGNMAEAAAIFDRVLAAAPPGSLAQAAVWTSQGEMERVVGNSAKAMALHRRAVSLLKDNLQGFSYLPLAQLQLAKDEQALQQFSGSESTLRTLVNRLDRKFIHSKPELTEAYFLLGQLLASRDNTSVEARAMLGRCVGLRTQLYGVADARTREAQTALAALTAQSRS